TSGGPGGAPGRPAPRGERPPGGAGSPRPAHTLYGPGLAVSPGGRRIPGIRELQVAGTDDHGLAVLDLYGDRRQAHVVVVVLALDGEADRAVEGGDVQLLQGLNEGVFLLLAQGRGGPDGLQGFLEGDAGHRGTPFGVVG